ncbi:MAG: transposase [Lentisphaerae bacterium]|nr:transposase [Lentisphaerota bacterium]
MCIEKMEGNQPRRKVLPHERPAWVREDAVFFVTVCCEPRGQNQLCRETVAGKLFETVEFRQDKGEWYVHLLILMPDLMHGLISFPLDQSMRQVISEWKESVARRAGVRWQRGFFDHRLRNDEIYVEKAHYIRMNPVRKGLVKNYDNWPYVWPKKT